jgi:hypothetical protein
LLFLCVGQFGEEIEAGSALYFIDCCHEVVQRWFRDVQVGDDRSEHPFLIFSSYEHDFVSVVRNGDTAAADPLRI